MKKILVCFLAVTVCFVGWNSPGVSAQNSDVKPETVVEQLNTSIEKSFAAFNRKDLKGNMSFMHPDSPEYHQILVKNETTFSKYDVEAKLLEFEYIGMSGEYQLVRLKQSNIYACGPYSTELELLYALKLYQGQWKLWTIMQLHQKIIQNK
jgi:hypothetical protein